MSYTSSIKHKPVLRKKTRTTKKRTTALARVAAKRIAAERPPFVLLENVDRLLKSPFTQRGSFGFMLRCLADLGYGVEWRVINAADCGFPQKKRRTYIFA